MEADSSNCRQRSLQFANPAPRHNWTELGVDQESCQRPVRWILVGPHCTLLCQPPVTFKVSYHISWFHVNLQRATGVTTRQPLRPRHSIVESRFLDSPVVLESQRREEKLIVYRWTAGIQFFFVHSLVRDTKWLPSITVEAYEHVIYCPTRSHPIHFDSRCNAKVALTGSAVGLRSSFRRKMFQGEGRINGSMESTHHWVRKWSLGWLSCKHQVFSCNCHKNTDWNEELAGCTPPVIAIRGRTQ